uniref:Uncharacterized protein n=1 Tax=Vespula pensylvanica TaxID=30213 RepID=A0A834KRB7_VESPE|nr:hypothetical protein H0235_013707 [Vespula pensylvanica]
MKEKGLAHVVVYKLLNMARSLFEKHIFLTGTIRIKRKYIPPHIKQKLHMGEYKYSQNREILLESKKSQKQNNDIPMECSDIEDNRFYHYESESEENAIELWGIHDELFDNENSDNEIIDEENFRKTSVLKVYLKIF